MSITRPNSVHTRGFTLVELLVVISIIGILVAIVYVNFDSARKQSRDRVRQAQLQELQVAVELYKDKYGSYPLPGCGTWAGPTNQTATGWSSSCDNYIVGHEAGVNFVPNFIKELPTDPLPGRSGGAGIYYYSNGTDYKILQFNNVESLVVDSRSHPFNRYHETCGGASVVPNTYAVYSAGTLCL